MKWILIILIVLVLLQSIFRYILNLNIKTININRKLNSNRVFIGDKINVVMTIENTSRFRIPFVFIEEKLPVEINMIGRDTLNEEGEFNNYKTSLGISRRERIKRFYSIKANKRGVYNLDNIKLLIGDSFGLLEKERLINSTEEVVVYPKYQKLNELKFINNNLMGDRVVQRWIFEDPLIIKGLREYNTSHRMKDIHWNSSLRVGKLMAKEYEYTSEKEIVVFLNTQFGYPVWNVIDSEKLEEGISLAMSICDYCITQAVSTSFWTNGTLIGLNRYISDKSKATASNLDNILDLGARISKWSNVELSTYLESNKKYFNFNNIYIIILSFIDESSENILRELINKGVYIKIIDISRGGLYLNNLNIERYIKEGEKYETR